MASRHLPTKTFINLAHLPTLMLAIGYPVYWLEVYFLRLMSPEGVTTPLALNIFVVVAIIVFWQSRDALRGSFAQLRQYFHSTVLIERLYLAVGCVFVLFILACAFRAALLPPHLQQEYDALNYHLTIPRQHLILGSFAHIPWSTADLFPLPINFALAPYWLVTILPNKLPQFIFLLGLIAVSVRIVNRLTHNSMPAAFITVFSILGVHALGIQMGTAMTDIILCYLFLAFIDSWLDGADFLAAIELTFYFWAKSFSPLLVVFVFVGTVASIKIFQRLWKVETLRLGFEGQIPDARLRGLKKILVGFLFLSLFVGAPFVGKSLYYAGTPLYPFATGIFPTASSMTHEYSQSLEGAAQTHLTTKDQYGHGRSAIDLAKHFWLLAVPEAGVNNSFDYPLGLAYLIFIGPFFVLLWWSFKSKEIPLIPIFIVIFWASWWMGSQQSRFLYVPVLLIIICVIPKIQKSSYVLMGAVILSLMLNALSVYRAHRDDFAKHNILGIIRDKDRELLLMNREYLKAKRTDAVELEFHDAAFAQFPVSVIKEKWPYVIRVK